MEGKLPEDVRSLSVHLPGDKPIEGLFREMVVNEPSKVAEATGCPDLDSILFALQGSDHHDWYEKLSEHIGHTKGQPFAVLFAIWSRDEVNVAKATTCYKHFITLME